MITKSYAGSTRWLVTLPWFDGSQPCATAGDVFYAPDGMSNQDAVDQNRSAKKVCNGCPFLDECRTYALAHEAYGVWGGTTAYERQGMRKVLRLTVTSPDEIDTVFGRHTNIAQQGG